MTMGDQNQRIMPDEQALRDQGTMWVDLLQSHLQAESARCTVTRRAEVYLRAAGLPLERVLDALRTDEPGWTARVAELREQEEVNRAVPERFLAERCSCQGQVS